MPGRQVAELAGSLARVVESPGCRVARLPTLAKEAGVARSPGCQVAGSPGLHVERLTELNKRLNPCAFVYSLYFRGDPATRQPGDPRSYNLS